MGPGPPAPIIPPIYRYALIGERRTVDQSYDYDLPIITRAIVGGELLHTPR
jgi:hypothetical protein